LTEWQLFEPGTVPDFTTPAFFEAHPWVDPRHQLGHAERTAMTADLIRKFVATHPVASLVDLGCGDGSLLGMLRDLPIRMWGYDAGVANVGRAKAAGLDVRRADLLSGAVEYADLIVATEVVEHLVDPRAFIRSLPGRRLVLSSPSAEDADWHYEHHSFAWDLEGYASLAADCGWTVVEHVECDAPDNHHGGIRRPQRFQAISATR
jgi:predicted TPR repeat methyltransferase